jgi:hypothetical protein
VIVLALLAAGGVALSVGVPAAIERARPGFTSPPPPRFTAAPIPRLDAHQHVTAGTVDEAGQLARAHWIGVVVNHDGGVAGAGLEEAIAAASKARKGHVVQLANLDFDGCCDAAWSRREAERLATAKDAGARGVALPEVLGDRTPLALDAPALDPVFDACDRLRLPVFVHGAPLAALERRLDRHANVAVVATAFAGLAGDPPAWSALLDRHPNLRVDTARLGPAGLAPAATRAAILSHADRVLFGSEIALVELPPDVKAVVFGGGGPGGREEMHRFFEGTWRFFETRDAGIPTPVAVDGGVAIEGLGLPRDVLERVYRRNGEALLGVTVPEEGP